MTQTNMHNIFPCCGQPEYFRLFAVVCWAGPTGRELPNIFPYLGSKNALGEQLHYIFGIFRPLQINHVCDNFRPHGSSRKPKEVGFADFQGRNPELGSLTPPVLRILICTELTSYKLGTDKTKSKKNTYYDQQHFKRDGKMGDGKKSVTNCRKMSQSVLRQFLTICDVLCQWEKEIRIVIQGRENHFKRGQTCTFQTCTLSLPDFGLNHLTPPFHAFSPPPSSLLLPH